MPKVIIKKTIYDYGSLKPVFFEIMDALGGNEIKKHHRILIKPNLLSPASPQQAVLTHPMVIRAAVEYVLGKGAHPQVSDSPAMGSFEKILRDNGIKEALKDLDVACRSFEGSLKVDIGEPFNMIDLAEDALNVDMVINLPKLKAHSQMLLTLGVKNMFGCVVGFRKPEWHMRTGMNHAMFTKLLVLIYQKISPSFTILDGILAMEGDGPGSGGTPRELGVMIGSRNAFAVDETVCRMLNLLPDRLATQKAANDMGLLGSPVEIDGHLPEIHDFKLPPVTPLMYGPRRLHGFLRRHLLQRPVCDDIKCQLCKDCQEICPAGAISFHEKALRFDYDRCIRCYCCIEVCPYGALHVTEPIPGKLLRKLATRYF